MNNDENGLGIVTARSVARIEDAGNETVDSPTVACNRKPQKLKTSIQSVRSIKTVGANKNFENWSKIIAFLELFEILKAVFDSQNGTEYNRNNF